MIKTCFCLLSANPSRIHWFLYTIFMPSIAFQSSEFATVIRILDVLPAFCVFRTRLPLKNGLAMCHSNTAAISVCLIGSIDTQLLWVYLLAGNHRHTAILCVHACSKRQTHSYSVCICSLETPDTHILYVCVLLNSAGLRIIVLLLKHTWCISLTAMWIAGI